MTKKRSYIHDEMNSENSSMKSRVMGSLRELVFGLEDGVVSTLGAITGIAASTRDEFIVILSGFVIIFVESVSMAAGTFLSSKSERQVEEQMLREEAEEIELYPEKEKQELRDFYTQRGFTAPEVEILVNRVTKDKKLWLEEMAFKELGVIPNKHRTPYSDAFVMGIAYIIGGLVALTSYFVFDIGIALPVSIVVSISCLFLLGWFKGGMVRTSKLRSGLEMMLVSATAAAVGFVVGQIVNHFFSVSV